MKKFFKNKTVDLVLSILVCMISGIGVAVGVKVFLTPNSFVSAGFTGIAMLIGRLFDKIQGTNYESTITGILYFVMNIPVMILAWKKLSKRFTILSAVQAITSSIVMIFLPDNLNEVFNLQGLDLLAAAVFVGILNGFFNSIAFMVGGSAGGLDVVSLYFAVKKQTSIGVVTTSINSLILICSVFVNGIKNGLSLALFTLVYIIVAALVIDFFYSRNKRVVLFITTTKGKEITDIITHEYVRGVTVMNAKGGFTDEPKQVLYCACLSVEAPAITETVKSIDEHAFISIINITKLYGNFLSKEIKS